MDGHKFRVRAHGKIEEKRKSEVSRSSENTRLTVSLPISVDMYFNRPAEVISPCIHVVVSLPVTAYFHVPAESLEVCLARLSKLQVPPLWILTQADPNLYASLPLMTPEQLSLSIRHDFSWAVSVGSHGLDPTLCPDVPEKFTAAFSLNQFLNLLDKQ